MTSAPPQCSPLPARSFSPFLLCKEAPRSLGPGSGPPLSVVPAAAPPEPKATPSAALAASGGGGRGLAAGRRPRRRWKPGGHPEPPPASSLPRQWLFSEEGRDRGEEVSRATLPRRQEAKSQPATGAAPSGARQGPQEARRLMTRESFRGGGRAHSRAAALDLLRLNRETRGAARSASPTQTGSRRLCGVSAKALSPLPGPARPFPPEMPPGVALAPLPRSPRPPFPLASASPKGQPGGRGVARSPFRVGSPARFDQWSQECPGATG